MQTVEQDGSGAIWNKWDTTDAPPPGWAAGMLGEGERINQALHMRWRPEIDAVSSVRALNQWIRSYAREQNIELVDYFAALDDGKAGLSLRDSSDGVHPTAAGYAKMEAKLQPFLAD